MDESGGVTGPVGELRSRPASTEAEGCLIAGGRPSGSRAASVRLPNRRVQRTRSSASPPRSPLTRYPLGRAVSVIAAMALVAFLACSTAADPAPSLTTGSDLDVFAAVIDCRPGMDRQLLDVTTATSTWKNPSELQRFLAAVMVADSRRPVISAETIAAFVANQQKPPLSLRDISGRAQEAEGLRLWCPHLRLVTEEQFRAGGLGRILAVSQIGFNRGADQALVVLSHHETSSQRGGGSDEWIYFLTRPAGQWVVVAAVPVSVV